MTENPSFGERVVLVHVNFPTENNREDIEELQELAVSAGLLPKMVVTTSRATPDPKYFIGRGKVEEIKIQLQTHNATLVLFNHALTPAQERNLEQFLECKVVDRTRLILDIFASRARTFEGQLQVELAKLQHLSTRLIRGWTHLERQKGGIGLRGGPGETQLETDRRLIKQRIKVIEERLMKLRNQRAVSRRARKRAKTLTVALVGYTNAGKSTLFNYLTESSAYTADQLFATLDPLLRRVELPGLGPVIMADTVGFIRHLPHDLVQAFHATLEEVSQADLLIHVVDVASEDKPARIHEVNDVLEKIGANRLPQIRVYNKIDRVPAQQPSVQKSQQGMTHVWLSAVTGEGIALLKQAIVDALSLERVHRQLRLPPTAGKVRAALYGMGGVLSETTEQEGDSVLEVNLPRFDLEQIFRRAGLPLEQYLLASGE